MEDLATWLAAEHGIDIQPEVKVKGYVNRMEVQARSSLQLWNPKLSFLGPKVSKLGTTMDGISRKFNMDGILLAPEDAGKPMAPIQFQLDLKWGTKPEENIYFTQASMKTEDHLALLNEIEEAVATQ